MSNRSEAKQAIFNAFNVLNSVKETTTSEKTSVKKQLINSGSSRKALDYLTYTPYSEILNFDGSFKPLAQELFNWDGGNKVNKPLIKIFADSIRIPHLFPHVLEFTSFVSSAAPLFEADHLAKMYEIMLESAEKSHNERTLTSFAPAKYTLHFSNNLERVFSGYSPNRMIDLMMSLWVESHSGRWWDITSGLGRNNNPALQGRAPTAKETLKTLVKAVNGDDNVFWSLEAQKEFARLEPSHEVAAFSEKIVEMLSDGEFVNPDVLVFLSSLNWLAPRQRPETPINGLLSSLIDIKEHASENYKPPKKPRAFSELFPAIYFQAGASNVFPLPSELFPLENATTIDDNVIHIIKTPTALAENARFMGNCTGGYLDRIKEFKSVILYVSNGHNHYNVGLKIDSNGNIKMSEINSRFNRGHVPLELRQDISNKVKKLDRISTSFLQFVAMQKNTTKNVRNLRYTVG